MFPETPFMGRTLVNEGFMSVNLNEPVERQPRESQRGEQTGAPAKEDIESEDAEEDYVFADNPGEVDWGGDQAAYVSPNRLKDAVITAKHLGIKTATTAWNSCTTANVNELAGKAGYIAGTTVSTVASVTGPLITSAATAASALAYGSGRLKESPTLNYSARKRVPPVPTLNPGPRAVDLAMTVALEDQLVPKRRTRLRKIQDKYMYDENDETLGEDMSGNREGKAPEKKRGIGPAAPRKLSDAQLEDVPQVRSRRVQELDDVPLDASVAWQRKPINEVEANSRELFKQEWLAKGERSERRTEEEWVRRVR